MTLQASWYRNGTWTEWFDVSEDTCLFTNSATQINFREKPAFEPGFYQNKIDDMNIEYFTSPVGAWKDYWRRVDVIPHDGQD